MAYAVYLETYYGDPRNDRSGCLRNERVESFDKRGHPLSAPIIKYATRAEALAVATRLNAEIEGYDPYHLAHDEYARPEYRVVNVRN